jgi:hypothetical protein
VKIKYHTGRPSYEDVRFNKQHIKTLIVTPE